MEHSESNPFPLIDPEQISMLMEAGGDESTDLFNEILVLFEEESRNKLGQIQTAAQTRDYHTLGRAVHALAGSSANIGGREVWLFSREIENLCKDDRGEEALGRIPALLSLFEQTLDQLRTFAIARSGRVRRLTRSKGLRTLRRFFPLPVPALKLGCCDMIDLLLVAKRRRQWNFRLSARIFAANPATLLFRAIPTHASLFFYPIVRIAVSPLIGTCGGMAALNNPDSMAIPHSALVADDESHIRTYVRLILTNLGVEVVHEASNGQQAVEAYKTHQPDVVFMDINMPGMTGIEALPQILEFDPDAIVVMLTGHASRHLIEGSAKAGAAHYIRKDTPREEISSMLQQIFDEIFSED